MEEAPGPVSNTYLKRMRGRLYNPDPLLISFVCTVLQWPLGSFGLCVLLVIEPCLSIGITSICKQHFAFPGLSNFRVTIQVYIGVCSGLVRDLLKCRIFRALSGGGSCMWPGSPNYI